MKIFLAFLFCILAYSESQSKDIIIKCVPAYPNSKSFDTAYYKLEKKIFKTKISFRDKGNWIPWCLSETNEDFTSKREIELFDKGGRCNATYTIKNVGNKKNIVIKEVSESFIDFALLLRKYEGKQIYYDNDGVKRSETYNVDFNCTKIKEVK